MRRDEPAELHLLKSDLHTKFRGERLHDVDVEPDELAVGVLCLESLELGFGPHDENVRVVFAAAQ